MVASRRTRIGHVVNGIVAIDVGTAALNSAKKPARLALLSKKNPRAGGILTHDLLNPIQAFYQAELRPGPVEIIHQRPAVTSEVLPRPATQFSYRRNGVRLR